MQRQVQVLLPWLERPEAIAALLGFRSPAEGENVSIQAATYEAQRAALLARAPFRPEPLDIEPLPAVIAERGDAVLRTLRPAGSGPGADTRLVAGIVDLRRLLSLQKAVTLEHIAQRVAATAQDDWPALADLCLPLRAADEEEELKGMYDKDGRGVTISSLNPNLRVTPVRTVSAVAGAGSRVVGFTLTFGTTHMHVAEYKGRYFLKDGYHRGYGLLARGITRAPVIVERAGSLADLHGGGTALMSPEHLLGTHPPLLTDFHSAAVSTVLWQQALRKIVRIRAEEFVVSV